MPSPTKTLAKGTAWGILNIVFLKSLGFLYMVALTRLFANREAELGIFFYVFGIVSIVAVFSDLGLGPGSLGRYVPYYVGRGEYNHVRAALKISLKYGTLFSLLCMLAVVLAAGPISSIQDYSGSPELRDHLVETFYIMSFFLFFVNFYSIAINFLAGKKRFRESARISNLQGLSKFILTMLLVFAFGSLASSVAAGFVSSFAVAAVLGMYLTYREYRRIPASLEHADTGSMLREMLPFGITLTLLSSISTMNSYIDRIFLGYLLPGLAAEKFNQITIYSVSTGFAPLVYMFSGSVVGSFMPVVSEAWGRKDLQEIKKASATLLHWTTIMSFPIFLMVLAFPAEILSVVYGAKYSEGATALVIYSIGVFLSIFSWPVYYVLSAMRRIGVSVKIILVGTLVNMALNALLIPGYGIEGAAIGSTASFIVMTALYLRIRESAHVRYPKSCTSLFWRVSLPWHSFS